MTKLSPTEIYRDRKIFLIGGTGFLGKVTLSMLLHRFPNIGRVYVTVRARSQEESETRFWNHVITAPPFDPLRERYGGAFEGFIREKVQIVGGDIGDDNLGYTEEEAQRIADDVDVVINTAGNVTFNPTLESALRTNVVGTQNVIAFTKRMKRPALVHVSTCLVAGNRSGAVREDDPVLGYFPRKDELPGVEFSVRSDVVINTTGNVTFNPTLESALRTNVVGTQNVIAFTKRMRRHALVHVSTCFVAGNRSGAVREDDPVLGYFPRKDELPGVELSL